MQRPPLARRLGCPGLWGGGCRLLRGDELAVQDLPALRADFGVLNSGFPWNDFK